MADTPRAGPDGARVLPGRLEPLGYDAFYVGALGIMAPSLIYKVAKGKYRLGWRDKLGFVPERGPGARIWLHAVSVGEAVAAGTLAEGLRRGFPGHELVASTVTPTGQSVAARLFGEERTFYLPLDFSGPARRAVARTKPGLIILMELEVWPNLIAASTRAGTKISPRSLWMRTRSPISTFLAAASSGWICASGPRS